MHSFDSLYKMDFVFSVSEAEDLEATARAIISTTLWMDWWAYSTRFLILLNSSEVKKLKRLFVVGAHCNFWLPRWLQPCVLKHRDVVPEKLKDDMSFVSFLDLCNAPPPGRPELIQSVSG